MINVNFSDQLNCVRKNIDDMLIEFNKNGSGRVSITYRDSGQVSVTHRDSGRVSIRHRG